MADQRGLLHILVEGPTEETIARDVIGPHLTKCGWWVKWSVVATKRAAGKPARRGGVIKWSQVEREISNLLEDSHLVVLTTMLDYYAFLDDAPGMADRPHGSAIERVEHVERALRRHFGDPRFIPHLILHETEAWVFAARDHLGNPALADKLQAIVDAAGGEELINDGRATAPSKRLLELYPGYRKTSHGPKAVAKLGLGALRVRCPHLDAWLHQLKA